MFKVLKAAVLVICALMLAFMFMPTGNSASEVAAGYQRTLVFTQSGTLPYQYMNVLEAGDPLLQEVEQSAGEHVDYVWVTEDGTPVPAYTKTSTFPRRGGNTSLTEDYTGGSGEYHMGTDLVPADGSHKTTPMYQVAIWGGTVIKVGDNPTGWGHYVVIDHGNNFYTRYAHMGYGNAGAYGGIAPAWQSDKGNASSILVKVGDVVQPGDKLGYIGTTGSSTGAHAHIELILSPEGFNDGANRFLNYYYGGVDNILQGGKELSEITWYQIKGDKSAITDMADWDALAEDEVPS